jgi:hypothetical protein
MLLYNRIPKAQEGIKTTVPTNIPHGLPLVNTKPIQQKITKGVNEKGAYTEKKTWQDQDVARLPGKIIPGKDPLPKVKADAYWKGLTEQQKVQHRIDKSARAGINILPKIVQARDTILPGMNEVKRDYIPAVKPPAPRYWTREDVVQPFGGNTIKGISTDSTMMAKGFAKNAIDRNSSTGARNRYETRKFTPKEEFLFVNGRMDINNNPIGIDTVGRGSRHDAMIQKILAKQALKGKDILANNSRLIYNP